MTLELEPVPEGSAAAAFVAALRVLAEHYGQPVDLDLPAELAAQIAKALPAHPSHYQPRVAGGQFTPLHPGNYNPRAATGAFRQRLTAPERQAAAAEAADLVSEFTDRMADHLADYQQRGLPEADFLARGRRDMERFYLETYRRGCQAVGDPAVLIGPQDKAAVGALIRDEMDYLAKFAGDLAAGRHPIPAGERIDWYGKAAREAFWLGWVLGDQRKDREIRWVLGTTEHCQTCLWAAGLGWQPALAFARDVLSQGYLPQSGRLDCKGYRCQCSLMERLGGAAQPAVVPAWK